MLYSLKISDIDMKNDAFDDDEEESNTNEGEYYISFHATHMQAECVHKHVALSI